MARLNLVTLVGTVATKEFDPRMIDSKLTDGENALPVLNFLVKCWDDEDKRFYTLPVAVWGRELSEQCIAHLKEGSLVYVQGELRYKFIYNKETHKMEKIYTTVKASTVEFISKKLKDEKLNYYMNEVKLIGNLVEDPNETEDGFVIAVDRLYPSKDLNVPNYKLTDYVTLVVKDKEAFRSKNLKKGSVAIVEGALMTRKKSDEGVKPRVVVNVKEIVGR